MAAKFTDWDSYFLPEPREPEEARVLRNLIGATTAQDLAAGEREITLARVAELELNPIEGRFDFGHHQAIHQYIFQDVYEWAGQPRTVDMGKTHRLWPAATLEQGIASTYGAIRAENLLTGLDREQLVARLAEHWGEVNVVHAFREGNTRSQRVFFGQLCTNAGYELDTAYLEAHYTAFNTARENAMVTARSDHFAEFLSHAVSPSARTDDDQATRDAAAAFRVARGGSGGPPKQAPGTPRPKPPPRHRADPYEPPPPHWRV